MFAIANATQRLIVSQMAESPSVQHIPATNRRISVSGHQDRSART